MQQKAAKCHFYAYSARPCKVKDVHLYLEPLNDELKYLWKIGIVAYDVSVPLGKEKFTLGAVLLWTIHVFVIFYFLNLYIRRD